jgi:predicted amidohydrolase YtcJ
MRAFSFMVLTLFLAVGVMAQRAAATPDTIFVNGKVITVDSGFTIQQAFAVAGDSYVAVGTNARIRALAGKSTRVIDLGGSAVIPGLSDNHDHLYNSGKVMRGINLVGATTTDEVLRRLREGMARAKPGETVFGSIGWRADTTRADLDKVSATVPVVALRGRRGAALLNGAALKKLGVSKENPNYMGKPFPKDASGELSGALPDWPQGVWAMDAIVPPPTNEEEEQIIVDGQKQRAAIGITSIRELSDWPFGMRAFGRMWQQGRLTLRVSIAMDLPDAGDPSSLIRQQAVVTGFGDRWLRIDSTSEEPWPPTNISLKDYITLVREYNRLGWRPSPHTPSNESLDNVLQAYEAADRDNSIVKKRWVIEHIPNVTPPLMDRIAKLGVIVSTNTAGYASNYDQAVRNLGKEQADRQTPVRELLDHHIVVVTGSDYSGPNPDTMTPNNPFIPLYYYISRKTRDGRILGPQEKISRQEALRIATNNNAFTTWDENIKGSIQAGKVADFVILSGDFMTVPEDQILQLHPLATYVAGKRVFSAPDAGRF